ncbi:MAG: ATP-grasp domain-containing protein [Candidatus Omnitrophica bacterium]|nr:ATP-grasp domain-containing protein [Candidatus Omnitrophota bacterium]MCM8800178.1 ATP-grasp domain-containing protein [Candidatus Omnitrophota bacterium]
MIVGLTYDLKTDYKFRENEPPDANAEFDLPQTVDTVASAIESLGFKVKRIGNVYNLLKNLDNLGVDIVFNIAEGKDTRNRESQVPVILETLGIPYVGSDGLTLGLTLDKITTKRLMISEGIPTPKFFEAKTAEYINVDHLNFPLIVKPRYEGSSKGLDVKAKVDNEMELKERIKYIISTYKQPALVEEFIRGYEFTVAIVGNDEPKVFAPVQTKIDGRLKPGDLFYSFERLIDPSRIEYIFPPLIEERFQKEMMELALKVYRIVDCRDFGRVDFRMDEDGHPYVLEINPLPCLSTEDVFKIIADKIGISYKEMIGKILFSALRRYNLKP